MWMRGTVAQTRREYGRTATTAGAPGGCQDHPPHQKNQKGAAAVLERVILLVMAGVAAERPAVLLACQSKELLLLAR